MTSTNILPQENLEEIDPTELLGYSSVLCKAAASGTHLVLKEDNLFMLTDEAGNVTGCDHSQMGLFFEDTRFLSRWDLSLMGEQPLVLSSQANRAFCSQIDMTTTGPAGGKDVYEHNFLHIRRRQVVSDKLIERLRISNYLNFPQRMTLVVHFAADFVDMFEVRGMKRPLRGTYYRPIVRDYEVIMAYRGRDKLMRLTHLYFDHTPTRLDAKSAEYDITIPGAGTFLLEIHVSPMIERDKEFCDPASSYRELFKRIGDDYSNWRGQCTSFRCDNEYMQVSLGQTVTDLRALGVTHEGQKVISAGIPWFSTAFGRDALLASAQSLMVNPSIARDTLRFLARHQGEKIDNFTAEEPGKIMHEIRRGEMANCREIPHIPYYGTVDATPLFLVLMGEYYDWTADLQLMRELLPHADRALQWIDEYGDVDGDGFVEYWKYTERGILHQGWKDSLDGVIMPDGSQPELPVALVEVQGYICDAKFRMSRIYRDLGYSDRARELKSEAQAMQRQIDEVFWMKEERFYALALDAKKRQIPSVTSNPGHLLWSRALTPGDAAKIERRLLADDMFSGWGIRSMSSRHAAYNPLSYHNGSVWPHDNSLAAKGMCYYNLKWSAERVFTALYEASLHFQYYRLPELFCGMTRIAGDSPVHYPVACTPQAWAAASFPMILQGLLGLKPDAPRHHLRIENPHLPALIGDMTIRDMRVGESRVTLHVTRQNERTFVNIVEQTGEPLRVTIEWQ